MFHFLAKLGKKPWAKAVMPIVAASSTVGYLSFHLYCHNFVRDLLAAHIQPGKREELSGNLKAIIMNVYKEIKDDFNVQLLKTDVIKRNPPTIKWFASSTAEPVTLGMSEANAGVLIGLPNYYNYEKREDVPENLLEVSKIRLFKSPRKNDSEDPNAGEDNISRTRIDKNSTEGQQYIDSLLLTEKAKKFSIARELFMGDSYRPLAIAGVIFLSMTMSIFLPRAAIYKLRLSDSHVSYRLSFYLLSGLIGYTHYIFFADSTDRIYCQRADSRAIKVSEEYKEGAIEYFSKIIERNKALRKMIDDMKFTYDEDGNIIDPIIRYRHIPLTERLEAAKNSEQEE